MKLPPTPKLPSGSERSDSVPTEPATDAPAWATIDSRALRDRILVVFDPRDLVTARQAQPGLAIYFPPELDDLARQREADPLTFPAQLRAVHAAKRLLNAWIVPGVTPSPRSPQPLESQAIAEHAP